MSLTFLLQISSYHYIHYVAWGIFCEIALKWINYAIFPYCSLSLVLAHAEIHLHLVNVLLKIFEPYVHIWYLELLVNASDIES